MADTFVIRDANGQPHRFPASIDPQRAAQIVRAETITPETAQPLGPPNQHTATTEEFRDKSVPEGPLDYAKQMLTSGAGYFGNMLAGGVKESQAKQSSLLKGPSPDTSPGVIDRLTGIAYDTPKAVLGAMNTDNPKEAGERIVDALGYLPLGERVLKDPAAAIRNVPADLATTGRALKTAAPYAAAGAAGYAWKGIPGLLEGLAGGGVVHKALGQLERMATAAETATPKAAETAATKTARLPKEKQPRLTQPGLDTTIADELSTRLDKPPKLTDPQRTPPADDLPPSDTLSPDAIKSRIAEADQHAADVQTAQRPAPPQPVEGARLVDPQNAAALADELSSRLDAQQGQAATVDPNALDAQTQARLNEAQASPARGTARIGPDGQPVIESAATDHTKPSAPPPSPNAGGTLTSGQSPRQPTPTTEAVTQSLQEMLDEQAQRQGFMRPEPTDTQGVTDQRVGDALAHTLDQVKQQAANKAAAGATAAQPTPPSQPPPAPPTPAGEVNLTMQGRPSAPPAAAPAAVAPAAAATTLADEVATRLDPEQSFRNTIANQVAEQIRKGRRNPWRFVDAVPPDAPKRALGQPGGSIIEATEGIPALEAEREMLLRTKPKNMTPEIHARIDELSRALRQRNSHITTDMPGRYTSRPGGD